MNWPIKSSELKNGHTSWHMTQSGPKHIRVYKTVDGVIQEEVRIPKDALKYLTEKYK